MGEQGISGVQKALGVLKDYYQGAAFVQGSSNFDAFMQQPAAPKKHSAASGAGGSIIDILEVCESDFAKNLASVEQEEADAVDVYEKTTQGLEGVDDAEDDVTEILSVPEDDVAYVGEAFERGDVSQGCYTAVLRAHKEQLRRDATSENN